MALVKCKECGNEISSKAEQCPHCGVKINNVESCCSSCGCLILIVFFMMSCAAIQESSHSSGLNSAKTENLIAKATKTIKTYKKGETIHVGYWSYCIWDYEWTNKLSDNEYINEEPDYTFLKINEPPVDIKNFLVSARNNNPQSLFGVPVCSLSEGYLLDEEDFVLIAVQNRTAVQMTENLKKQYFRNYFVVDDELNSMIVEKLKEII